MVFAKLDRFAMGVAAGAVSAILLFVLTMILVIKGGPDVGAHLRLLSNYFPGYQVTVGGAVIGAGYALIAGSLIGWAGAAIRNVVLFLYWIFVKRRAEHAALRHLMEVI